MKEYDIKFVHLDDSTGTIQKARFDKQELAEHLSPDSAISIISANMAPHQDIEEFIQTADFGEAVQRIWPRILELSKEINDLSGYLAYMCGVDAIIDKEGEEHAI